MAQGTVHNIINSFRLALEARSIKIDKMILFGSHATGRAREESDIDLVIISKDFKGKGYWERINILSDAIYEIFKPIEAVAMTPEEWERKDSFIAYFAQDGEVVYAA